MTEPYLIPFVTNVHLVNKSSIDFKGGFSACNPASGGSMSMDMPDTLPAGASADFQEVGFANLRSEGVDQFYTCSAVLYKQPNVDDVYFSVGAMVSGDGMDLATIENQEWQHSPNLSLEYITQPAAPQSNFSGYHVPLTVNVTISSPA